ncbi:uncharacterized protein LOC131948548 [Physella acuta]|uniref:uncharacterized protein LOC131948548 n=1 Tax=Physella acuta TaxID=109671 RepID=UPI0027DE9A78|nr:uncharacterized protein LOC131948548 [Physella acuta]XP_059166106.1 uncharacterized protein LOC131948548 [Physella acuta]
MSEEMKSCTDLYAGPQEFMEAGTRGFLVTTLPGKEEFAIDDAIDLLRQASIKLYGGIKPKGKKFDLKLGYVKIDFMDPQLIKVLPTPEGEETEEVEDDIKTETENNESTPVEEADTKSNEKSSEPSESQPAEMDTEPSKDKETSDSTDIKEEYTEKDDTMKEETAKDDSEKGDASKEDKEKGDTEKDDAAKNDSDQKADSDKKEVKKEEVERMRSIHKFKAFRTEMRNVLFIKSNIPDPMELAEAAMEIIIERKKVTGDAVCQLLPVLGVCDFNNFQLEVMTRRVLAHIFTESEEPKCFSVMLLDKLSEPGSELLAEIVRNTIWSINPSAWLSSPLTEPDVIIRLELIGSKLVLSCLNTCMRYRHYSPTLLVELGVGEAEDDDGTWTSTEQRKQQEVWRLAKEKLKELEKQKEEERKKEREKRKAEIESRRKARKKDDEKNKSRKSSERKKKSDEHRDSEEKDENHQSEDDKKHASSHNSDEERKEVSPPKKKPKLETEESKEEVTSGKEGSEEEMQEVEDNETEHSEQTKE